MKVTEVKYTRRYNVGPYEHEEYTVHATLDEANKKAAVNEIKELKEIVADAHGGSNDPENNLPSTAIGPAATELAGKQAKPGKGKNPKKDKSEEVPKVKKPKDEEPEETDEVDDNDDDDNDDEVDDDAEEAEDIEDEPKPPKKGKAEKAPKKFKKKAETYSRTNEIHKKLYGETLALYDKAWKKSEKGKAAAKKVSQKLEGQDFLNEEGEVLDSFVKSLRKEYQAANK